MSTHTLRLIAKGNNTPTPFELASHGGKIRPCPFCARSHIVFVNEDGDAAAPDAEFVQCQCYDCGATGPRRDNRVHALAVWQRTKFP
jgi:hypothetical protein